ncbi:hypothetical protein HanIR_Chr16g0822301 [Helianthus annuus]|nr:hypothetical protein HanIR_Chr16g0822301 [Helianthus annuus]
MKKQIRKWYVGFVKSEVMRYRGNLIPLTNANSGPITNLVIYHSQQIVHTN